MGSFVGSRLLGLFRDIAIGQAFGTSAELDAYLAAFRVPDTLFQLLAGAAMGSAFIPVFSGYLTRGEVSAGWRLASSVVTAVVAVLTVAAVIAFLLAPLLVRLIAPGFIGDPAQLDLAIQLTRIMLVSPVVFGASGLFMAILNARQHFLWPAVAPMTYNLAIMLAALLFGRQYGVQALAVGVVVGSFLHLIVQVPELRRQGFPYRPAIDRQQAGFRQVLILMGPRMVGLAAVQFNFLVTTMLASTLMAGSLAALNYAYLIMMAPLGIFGMAIATAVFPTMAEQAALGRWDEIRRMLGSALRLILFLTMPAIAFLAILADPVVGLLFQRGEFDDFSRELTAYALPFYAAGLAGHATIEISTRVFYACHDTRTPVTYSIGSMILYVVLGFWLIQPLELAGLALALSIAATIEGVILLVLAGRRLGSFDLAGLGGSLARTLAATAGLAAACWLGRELGENRGNDMLGWLVSVATGIGLGGLLFLAIAWVTRSPELRLLGHQVARRFGRGVET